MISFFLGIYDYLRQHRRLCMGLLFSMTAVLAALVATLSYSENIFDFLPMSDNQQKALTIYQDISGGQSVIVMVSNKDGEEEDTERMAEALDAFAGKVQKGSGARHIRGVTSEVNYDTVMGITDMVYQNMPLMLSDSDYVRMEQLLATPDYADEQLMQDVEMMMMPSTGFFGSSISNDPLGLFTPVMDRLREKQLSLDFELDDGHIFTQGRKYVLAMLESNYGAMESANNAELVAYVDSVAKETMQEYPDIQVSITGAPVIAVGNAQQIKTDSQWAISIAVTLIIFLLFFSFRRLKNFGLIGAGILFGLLFALGLISMVRSEVSLIVLGIGSVIIGIAANYPLHFIAHAEQGGKIREVLKEMVPPLLIGNITTVGAFASLLPLKAAALRDLGLFASLMLIGTILFVLVFLPHLVKEELGAGQSKLPFGRISSFSFEGRSWLLVTIICLTAFFGYFSLGTSFDANVQHINYMTDEQTHLLSDLQASAGINDTTNVYVVTEADTWDEALAARSRISPAISQLKSSCQINAYTDACEFICSQGEQQQKIERWNTFWALRREQVGRDLAACAPQYGFSEDAFDDFLRIIHAEYEPRPFEFFEPIRSVLLRQSFSTSTGRCAVIDVLDASGKDIDGIEAQLDEAVHTDGFTFDFVGMNSSIARSLSDDFNYIGFACGLIVFIFLWLSFGRFEISIIAFLPMALGWVWILGAMNIIGIQFNIVNIILATFIFGQGDDYTIFITDGLINEHAYRKSLLPSYKNSIIISALIIFIGMGALIVSRHPALHSLAEVTIVGMLVVVLMAWVVPPLVFHWLIKHNGQMRRTPITLGQVVRTGLCAVFYVLGMVAGRLTGTTRCWMRMTTKVLFGVKSFVPNLDTKVLGKGGIVVCNHQSWLDCIYVRSLFSHAVIFHTDDPKLSVLMLKQKVTKIIEKGGFAVFFDCDIMQTGHFCSLPFDLAAEIGTNITPLYLHGSGHCMPLGTHFIARGQIDVEIGAPVGSNELDRNVFERQYLGYYEEMRCRIENSHYFHHYLIYKYIYKGYSYEKETRRLLKCHDDYSEQVDNYQPSSGNPVVDFHHAGRGQLPLLFALVHPEVQVNSYHEDADDYALVSSIEPMPANLHVFHEAD